MNDKIKELKKAIENNSIEYEDLTVENDRLTLLNHVAVDEITFEITIKDDCYIVIEKLYSELTGMTIKNTNKFNSLKEVLDFIY